MISRTIALALALVSIIGVLVVRLSSPPPTLLPLDLTSHYSFLARECQETPLLAARNSSLVRPRIIARVNGSFFSMLRLVHTKHDISQANNGFFTCRLAIVFPLLISRGILSWLRRDAPRLLPKCPKIFS